VQPINIVPDMTYGTLDFTNSLTHSVPLLYCYTLLLSCMLETLESQNYCLMIAIIIAKGELTRSRFRTRAKFTLVFVLMVNAYDFVFSGLK